MATLRTNNDTWQPDYRREPRTSRYCAHCQKDIKAGSPAREVQIVHDGAAILHPDDWDNWNNAYTDGRGRHLIGADCARRIGLEWSRPETQGD